MVVILIITTTNIPSFFIHSVSEHCYISANIAAFLPLIVLDHGLFA